MPQEILGKMCYKDSMPELPEVETVCRQLAKQLEGAFVQKIETLRPDLRSALPPSCELNPAQKVIEVRRRSKYILIELQQGAILSHLGMTGAWRFEDELVFKPALHDHVILHLKDQRRLVYNDPRRFGVFEWFPQRSQLEDSSWLKNLGPEPLSEDWSVPLFWASLKRSNVCIKIALMNPKLVVGVGNIYASEILFRAKVRPTKKACRITKLQAERIFQETRKVLTEAIQAGGSTIENFRNVDLEQGGFQQQHRVYGRENLPCCFCNTPIRAKTLGGRSTYWCPSCQQA
jgi:formamidopyrimidine-DNA glycosylase